MILELERTRLAFFDNLLLCPELLSTAAEADTELPSFPPEDANRSASDIYLAIFNSQSGSAGNFCYQPKSWNYNNIAKAKPQPRSTSNTRMVQAAVNNPEVRTTIRPEEVDKETVTRNDELILTPKNPT